VDSTGVFQSAGLVRSARLLVLATARTDSVEELDTFAIARLLVGAAAIERGIIKV